MGQRFTTGPCITPTGYPPLETSGVYTMESTITEIATIPVWRCECRTYTKETDIYCAECGKLLPRAYAGLEPLSGHTSPDTAYVVDDYPEVVCFFGVGHLKGRRQASPGLH